MKLLSTFLVALSFALAPSAMAASSDWVETPESATRLVTAVDATGTLAAVPAGIEIELRPGWKTYWRSPGDAGYPVTVDWQGSENLAAADLRWPVPHRFSLFGLDTFGYSDRVLFPVTLVPERPGEPMSLRARVNYLICDEICIPYQADLVLDLPAGAATASQETQVIALYETRVPGPGVEHGIEIVSVDVTDDPQPTISVVARSDLPFEEPDLIVEGTNDWRFPAPIVEMRDGNREVQLTIAAEALTADALPLDGLPLVFTLACGTRGAEFDLEAVTFDATGGDVGGQGLPTMLLIALLGGLILNLMPCVLPVLSLKLLSVVSHGGGHVPEVRRSFLETSAGIVVAFLILALALAGLRASGTAIGWGIQFQQPLFLLAMASVVTLFAANLAGWFEIPLPRFVGDRVSSDPQKESGLAGAFGTGLLATLLATPCSAPFVGTAVGFALARDTGDIVAIFLAMGLGLALPYLLVAIRPQIATALPKPGPWMIWLRRLLALALIGTAIWLLHVASATVGVKPVLVSALLLALLLILLWQRRRIGAGWRAAVPVLAVVLIAAALVPSVWRHGEQSASLATTTPDTFWQPFDQPAIDALVDQGRVVFVDVTADWCITCEVNKKLVLRREPVLARLSDPAVVAMQADWTQPDDGIAAYLASFGRYGIPFYAVYGPGAPDGIVLPELLDRDSVLEALDRASGG